MLCYCHYEIKSRVTCRPKSRCQSDLSTVSDLANKSLHQDLMHSGCRGTAVPNVCLQAFSLFPLPSSALDQWPVHRLVLHLRVPLSVSHVLSPISGTTSILGPALLKMGTRAVTLGTTRLIFCHVIKCKFFGTWSEKKSGGPGPTKR